MLYVDLPTLPELQSLAAARSPASVSIYLPTTPQTQHIGKARLELKNLARAADAQLEAAGVDKRTRWAVEEQIAEVAADDDFWAHQANALALFATPESHRTYRLPTRLAAAQLEVSDRFHLKPLYRLASQPAHAFILALEENGVRLVEMFTDMAPAEVKVPDMPRNAADAAGVRSVNQRQKPDDSRGSDEQKLRLRQYARKVDAALRPVLSGRTEPLILAAAEPTASLFRSVATYPHLLPEGIARSPARMSAGELAEAARPVLDRLHAARVAEAAALFAERAGSGRATADVADAARAATFGAVELLLVDIDEVIPGLVDETTGAVTFAAVPSARTYGVVDEIAGRVIASGGTVLGVRRDAVPGGGVLAAVLRYPV
jgi:hypothetical protein